MKKLFLSFVFAALIPLQACAQEQWQEGKHFKVISDTATEKPVVTEFFSFWCPACYNFEPLVAEIKKQLPEDVKFNKVHVNFMGFTSADVQDEVTRGMMIARAVKQEERLNGAIFNYIHKQRASITGLEDVRNIFVVNGVDEAEFDKLASSFGVNSMVQKNNKEIEKFRSHLSGVPNFIVNGKYQATFSRDMTPDDMTNLIVWLSKQK
ncbi:thiol:disulfide interchange protein DsbA/DsbL [Alteromonas oceanisediminis]|uniref:thiol:disulfide interchange protein DsbA/DsbL n=1 Tax=Alteromonas oceanisediminis TaxID=2836180 RepID=UPI001BDA463D|nr:thiol:disulfide interchange protein DsbA/DsbL [Alteromonas oceanisediminis]MBT0585330.1 thiol:disulfide interchange protein DsbA/DsbL [Alteromonas oceanisediminis]